MSGIGACGLTGFPIRSPLWSLVGEAAERGMPAARRIAAALDHVASLAEALRQGEAFGRRHPPLA
jgi:hypothetical protein